MKCYWLTWSHGIVASSELELLKLSPKSFDPGDKLRHCKWDSRGSYKQLVKDATRKATSSSSFLVTYTCAT